MKNEKIRGLSKMKKKWPVFFPVLVLIIMTALAGCAPADEPAVENGAEPGAGEHWELNFSTFWPAEDFQVEEGHKAWAREIKERVEAETPHTIEFAWHPSGVLLGPTEIYEGVADGASHLGSTCPSYTPGIFPVTAAFELPGLENNNALVSSMVIQEAFETYELVQQEYEDVKVMHFWATGPGDILSNEPIETLEDLEGMEIRVAGGSVPVMDALGAEPVTMAMSESYVALDTGIVDGILSPTDVLRGFMLAEVTDYITKTPQLYNITFMKIMNMDTWNAFPEEVQQIFEEVNEKYVYEYGVLRAEHTLEGQEFAVDEYGHRVIELSPEEEERWLEAIEPVQQQWIDDATADGLPGEEIMNKVLELDQKYSEQYGDYFE